MIAAQSSMVTGFLATARQDVTMAVTKSTSRSSSSGRPTTVKQNSAVAKPAPIKVPTASISRPRPCNRISGDEVMLVSADRPMNSANIVCATKTQNMNISRITIAMDGIWRSFWAKTTPATAGQSSGSPASSLRLTS